MTLNLARKWRSKQFDEIIGQPLAVRLVKNSLYRNLLFPVYLLSGTRGTGKTSTARIFAAALNCEQLALFQKDPKNQSVPCLTCHSCKAMHSMNHPDFIEIDAASHTGVDNVRQIIDAASFVPVLGTKKIYLIDEAHMLSKAAFNAFLKILEEPPDTVVFMLATTDPHKIIQTVTSRCFQLYFDPIKPADVVAHLNAICIQESLSAEPDALRLIAQETEGSMRDALNLLERLRTLPDVTKHAEVPGVITKLAVIDLLGSIDDERLSDLLKAIVTEEVPEVLAAWVRLQINRYSPPMVWKKFVEILRRALWLKQGTYPDDSPVPPKLQEVVSLVSYDHLIKLLDVCYGHELSFTRTSRPGMMLELLVLKLCQVMAAEHQRPPTTVKSESNKLIHPVRGKTAEAVTTSEKSVSVQKVSRSVLPPKEQSMDIWDRCLQEIETLSDPLVVSIFKQSMKQSYNTKEKILEMTFSKDLLFFKEWLEKTQNIWEPIISRFFGDGTRVVSHFTGPSTKQRPLVATQIKPIKKNEVISSPSVVPSDHGRNRSTQMYVKAASLDKVVSTTELERLTMGSLLMRLFPGRLMKLELSKEGA